jgi:hypothetical protein
MPTLMYGGELWGCARARSSTLQTTLNKGLRWPGCLGLPGRNSAASVVAMSRCGEGRRTRVLAGTGGEL